MATKMIDMGVPRKELYPEVKPATPKGEKKWENERVRPELRLSGVQAEMMGAEDLKKGDRIRQTVEWEVTDHVKREANGKPTEYEMTLCLDKASDCVACEGEDDAGDEDEDADEGESPAMAYIQGRAKTED